MKEERQEEGGHRDAPERGRKSRRLRPEPYDLNGTTR